MLPSSDILCVNKNATFYKRMLHFYLHFLYLMAFLELNPKNKKFQISAYRSIFK